MLHAAASPQLTPTCVASYLRTYYKHSAGTVDAPLVEKFDAFSIGPGEGPAADSGGGSNGTGGPASANTASPPRNGTGSGSAYNYSSMMSSNRAPALTASTMSTYDGDRGSQLSVSTANLNASVASGSAGGTITPTPTGSPSNRSCAYSRSDAGSASAAGGGILGGSGNNNHHHNPFGLNATGGSSASLGLGDGRPSASDAGHSSHHHGHHQPNQGTVPTSIGNYSSADSLAASPLIFDVSPSSSSDVYRSGGYSSSHLIASTGGHRRIISTESSSGGLPPPPPPTLERGSSQEVDAFLSTKNAGAAAVGSNNFSGGAAGTLDAGAEGFTRGGGAGGIAPRPFGSSATSSQTSGGSEEDGLRGLDALTNSGNSAGGRERAQTMPTTEGGAHHNGVGGPSSSYGSTTSSSHHRDWSTSDQFGGNGIASSLNSQASSASRLLSSSEPPKTSYLGGGAAGMGGMGVGGRPPLASSKNNLSDMSTGAASASSGGSPRGQERDNSFDYLQQQPSSSYGSHGHSNFPMQQQRSTSIGSQQEQYARGSIGAYSTSEYSMPEDRPVHGGDAYNPAPSAGLSAMPQPLNQHARSYSHGSAPMTTGRSSGTPLFGANVRERFATSDGIAEHQQTQYAPQYGGAHSHQQQHMLPRSVSTGSNVLMYATTGGNGGDFSSMRRSDSAPGHIVSSSVPSYQHYQDQSVHGGSRFSANRTPSSSSSSMYGQPQQHQQHYHQQPVYHTVDEHHEPIVLPQYGVATMPRPPANSAMGPGPKIVYHVQFKRSHRYFVLGPRAPRDIEVGTFVKVEADRGEDLGKIVDLLSAEHFNANSRNLPTAGAGYGDGQGPGSTCAADLKRITRRATKEEVDLLPLKNEEEMELVKICGDKVMQRGLPMRIIDAEYQFDRHKLTFFFESDCRVDFRELVRDLFSIYKTRIWMEQLN